MKLTRIIGIAAVAVFGLVATTANAQNGYGALSVFDWSVEKSGLDKRIESAGLRATAGYWFNEIFAIEGHIATGGTDDIQLPVGSGTEDAEAELNKLLAGFAKLNLPLLDGRFNVYGLAGYAYGRVDVLAQTTETRYSQNSFAWGAGADVALTDRLSLTADYIDYISRTGISASAASLGLRLAFGQ